MKTKTFDCLRMKRAAQKMIRAAVAGMDRKAEVEFFRAGADEFERRLQNAKEAARRDAGDSGS
ncbi:MAG: hypothetical protein KAY37_06635 [Phycisphaerae bacterium]|nr:hypothetical protein [Phycisphaerae bacterium]